MNTEQTIRDYLPQIIHMSLATSRDNQPWVCEVHFAYDDDLNLYFRSLPSRRHSQEIADNPKVAGNIVKQHKLAESPVGVYFEGTARKLEAGAEQDVAFACLKTRLGIKNQTLAEASSPGGHHFYKISVNTFYVFGVFGTPKGQKYELKWGKHAQ